MNSKWAPVRKIWAAVIGFLTSTAGVAILDAVHVELGQTWPGVIVGAITVASGYLTKNKPAPSVPQQGA